MFEIIEFSLVGIFSVVVAFSLVIFVHEFGHYYVGKKCGIGVKEFSIGFGPKIFWFKDKSGVIWRFSLLPLGGFVRFEGDADPSSMSKKIHKNNCSSKQFHEASILARFLTVLAGPFANIVFSILLFSSLIFLNGITNDEPIIGEVDTSPFQNLDIKKGDKVLSINGQTTNSFSDIFKTYGEQVNYGSLDIFIKRGEKTLLVKVSNLFQPLVKDVEMLSPASRAGIQVGDLILKVDSKRVSSFAELKSLVQNSFGKPLVLDIWRNGIEIQKTLTPESRPIEKADGSLVETLRIGIIGGFALEPERETPSIYVAVQLGLSTTWRVIYSSIKGLAEIVKGSISANHLTGPIGIAHAITDVSKSGIVPFLSLVALISTGIAVINLFPLPILDGGHLLLIIYEKISGSTPSDRFMQIFMMFGLALILSLMLFATYNDILRIIL